MVRFYGRIGVLGCKLPAAPQIAFKCESQSWSNLDNPTNYCYTVSMSFKHTLERIISDLQYLMEFEGPEAELRMHDLVCRERNDLLQMVTELKIENSELKLEIARICLEFGRSQKEKE